MTEPNIRQAAELLVAARRTQQPIEALPAEVRPTTDDAAFAIQDAVLGLLGERAGGWKVGVVEGTPPTCAPMFASLIQPSPCSVPAATVPLLGVEAEIAVRIGKDLPPRATPYARADVLAAIDGVCAAIEIVHSRFLNYLTTRPGDKLADNVGNAGFVYGPLVTDWQKLDLTALKLKFEIGGKTAVERVGGNPSGDPIIPVIWLANHLTGRNGGLKAGQIVTTGSCVGLLYAKPGDRVVASFDGLGTAEVTFSW